MNKKINNFVSTKLQKSEKKLPDEQRVNRWVNRLIPDEWLRVDIHVETRKSEYSFYLPQRKIYISSEYFLLLIFNTIR